MRKCHQHQSDAHVDLADRYWKTAMPVTGKTLVMIATYNEIENLPRLVSEIEAHLPAADVLIIDDNSPDGTGQWCDQQAAIDPRLKCLHRTGKLGLGSAIVEGMKFGIGQGYEFVITMDADFSHPPASLPALLAGMQQNGSAVDVMIGSRYIPGGGIEGWSLKRHIMSRCINLYTRWMLWIGARDCSGGFRCYRTSKLAEIDLNSLYSKGYSFQEEMLWRAKKSGCRIAETPIIFVNRREGDSKINMGEARQAVWILSRLCLDNLVGRR